MRPPASMRTSHKIFTLSAFSLPQTAFPDIIPLYNLHLTMSKMSCVNSRQAVIDLRYDGYCNCDTSLDATTDTPYSLPQQPKTDSGPAGDLNFF